MSEVRQLQAGGRLEYCMPSGAAGDAPAAILVAPSSGGWLRTADAWASRLVQAGVATSRLILAPAGVVDAAEVRRAVRRSRTVPGIDGRAVAVVGLGKASAAVLPVAVYDRSVVAAVLACSARKPAAGVECISHGVPLLVLQMGDHGPAADGERVAEFVSRALGASIAAGDVNADVNRFSR
jgi:hypothetical protein